MIRFLRTASGRALTLAAIGFAGLMIGGAVIAAGAGGTDQKPVRKPLARAVAESLNGSAIQGVSARVDFTNRLIDSSLAGEGAGPLIGGGSGRLWADAKGNVRIELQSSSSAGDVQVVAGPNGAWMTDGSGSTIYRFSMPARHADRRHKTERKDQPLTVASVTNAIKAIAGDVTVSDPTPDNVGGSPAYTVTLTPKDQTSLLGGASVSWDAANGAPLAISILAKGQSDPVLSLHTTDVQFGPVNASIFAIQPPAGAKTVTLSGADVSSKLRAERRKAKTSAAGYKPVIGLNAVQAKVGFTIAAPSTLAGLDRSEVVLVGKGSDAGAIVSYGTGLGSILMLERPAKPNSKSSGSQGSGAGLELPTKKIGGVDVTELTTPLGTLAQFSRGGVDFTVAASRPAATVESAISGL
jgi:outer membrane lipoprotein-sorting protein